MIISQKNKYIFVELPRTGTTSIGKELIQNYDGVRLDNFEKHVTYDKFLKTANAEEKKYFVFSCIRNPLDKTASLYFKYRTDHHSYLSDDGKRRENLLAGWMRKRQFKFVSRKKVEFSQFFLKYYKLPYDDWSCLSHSDFDFIIRFESMDQDFRRVLDKLGIEPQGTLRQSNKTAKNLGTFLDVYTPDIREHAMWIFGPYMKKWGYDFPQSWEFKGVSRSSAIAHSIANTGRKVYWRYIR